MLQLPIRSRLEYSFKRLIGGAVTVNPSQAYPPPPPSPQDYIREFKI